MARRKNGFGFLTFGIDASVNRVASIRKQHAARMAAKKKKDALAKRLEAKRIRDNKREIRMINASYKKEMARERKTRKQADKQRKAQAVRTELKRLRAFTKIHTVKKIKRAG